MVDSWIAYPFNEDAEVSWLAHRHWDGIDKPEYLRFIKIDKNERSLRTGRFKHFCGWLEWYEVKDVVSIVFSPPAFRSDEKGIDELLDWVFSNANCKWKMGIGSLTSTGLEIRLWFEDPSIGTACKLLWC